MPGREPEPWESGAAAPFLWIETARGNVDVWALGEDRLRVRSVERDAMPAPPMTPEGVSKVSAQGADTDRTTPQPVALEAA
jgi:hypothetical protein